MMMIRYTTSAAGGSATGMEEVRCYTRSFFFNIKYDSFKSDYASLPNRQLYRLIKDHAFNDKRRQNAPDVK